MKLLDLISTFETIKANYPPIKALYVGINSELLNDLRNEAEYPAVVVELPEHELYFEDNLSRTNIAFAVLTYAEKFDFPAIKTELIACEEIAQQIALYLYERSQFIGDIRMMPMVGYSHSHLVGYRVTMRESNQPPCELDNNWL